MSTRSATGLPSPTQPEPLEEQRGQRLRSQLSAFEPADAQERQHREAMLQLLDAPGDPFDRARYAPGHFTASAFIVSPDHTQLLLILHGKLGLWLQPGGHIEPQDVDVEAGARREIEEETGLRDVVALCEGPFDLDVHRIPAHGQQPAHRHFDVRFLFEAAVANAIAGSDARDARLFPLAAMDATHSDRSVLRAVEKLQARLSRV